MRILDACFGGVGGSAAWDDTRGEFIDETRATDLHPDRRGLAVAGFGALVAVTVAMAPPPASDVDWGAVDALFSEYQRSDAPGCALGVVRDGVLEYGRGYGMANLDPTIRQVVHHTSGIRDYLTLMSLRGLRDDDYYTNAEVREAIARQRELNFTPEPTICTRTPAISSSARSSARPPA